MDVTMKNKELITLWNSLFEFSEKKGTSFAYAITKTRSNIEGRIDELMKLQVPSRKYVEYDGKRVALCAKYADKNEDGSAKQERNNYIVIENKVIFDEEMGKLNEEYKEARVEFEQRAMEFSKILQEDVTVKIHQIRIEDFPGDMTSTEMEVLLPLVRDESL